MDAKRPAGLPVFSVFFPLDASAKKKDLLADMHSEQMLEAFVCVPRIFALHIISVWHFLIRFCTDWVYIGNNLAGKLPRVYVLWDKYKRRLRIDLLGVSLTNTLNIKTEGHLNFDYCGHNHK